jgi:hypothetical protein
MSDERHGRQDADPDVPAGEDVIDISRNDGPELTTNVDDVDTGSGEDSATYSTVEPPD